MYTYKNCILYLETKQESRLNEEPDEDNSRGRKADLFLNKRIYKKTQSSETQKKFQ